MTCDWGHINFVVYTSNKLFLFNELSQVILNRKDLKNYRNQIKKGKKTTILYYTQHLPLTAQLVQPTWPTHPLGGTADFTLALVFVVTIDTVPPTSWVLYQGLDKS